MANFRFRLATFLKLKIAARDQRQAELMEVLSIQEQLVREYEETAAQLEQTITEARQGCSIGRLNVDDLIVAQRELNHLRATLAHKKSLQKKLAPHIEQRRNALLEAEKEVRSLEKLRERQEKRFADEQERRDSLQMDEIGLIAFARRER
ncbi:flagellar export protein FliJ [Blastopirellula marina]|uniref:Flagellar FliJ protein n=1 Tax=Blastopirellula marina TaxID=124 RepID=A0A2S8GRT8_9BACT|nr:flagellar export protein FliJ [Blastopirellula marina]PQO26264.1 flagellar export protein FliJ [Blastopirellula marina]PQO47143.1 flagellar export protein FliJ [Blastopirellula marina]PTL40664.1 flagellar export protein FliJ [Blastopirellula marina]